MKTTRSTSLPNTPLGRFGSQWAAVALDEEQEELGLPSHFAASSPPSPRMRGRGGARQRSASLFQRPEYAPALKYDHVDLVVAPDTPDDLYLREDPADDEAAERLLMLLSLPAGTASLDEVLYAVAGCYSARLSQHASAGGDSSALHTPLPLPAQVDLRTTYRSCGASSGLTV